MDRGCVRDEVLCSLVGWIIRMDELSQPALRDDVAHRERERERECAAAICRRRGADCRVG